jgi:hypothetical protein
VIAAMPVTSAGFSLFFNVRHFATRRHFAVATHDAAAPECGEAEKPNETHEALLTTSEFWSNCCAVEYASVLSIEIARSRAITNARAGEAAQLVGGDIQFFGGRSRN